MADDAGDDDALGAWRVRVFDRIHAGAAALALACYPLLIWGTTTLRQLIGYTVMFVAIVGPYAARRRLAFSLRASALTLALFVFGVQILVLIGYSPGVPLLFVLASVVAAISLRPRAALVLVLLSAAFVWAAMLLHQAGLWVPPQRHLADPGIAGNVVRLGIAYTGVAVLVVGAVAYAISVVERHALERSAALAARREAENALAQAQKLELVGQLASGICHDFNNALSVILTWTELLRSGKAGDLDEGLDSIKQAALSSAQLTRRLLVLGSHTARDLETVHLDRHLPELVRMLQRVLPENITLRCHSDHVPPIVADRGEIDHAVLNLALNARDAMPDGGTLEIRTLTGTPASAGNGELCVGIQVADSGAGMDAATQARLFEPFFSTKGARGTGLGLASVRAITTEVGGSVEVDSEPGRGTRFTLWFPARPDAAATDKAAAATPMARGSTILLAEDDPAVRRVMASTLRRAGHEVLEASTTDAALDIARRARTGIGLLCTDAVMPGAGVLALIDTFRALHPGAPVLICSGYLSPDLPAPEALGAAFLAKPFAPGALIAKVHELLALGHASPRTPIAGSPTLPGQAQQS